MAAVAARHSWLMSMVTKDQSSSLTLGIVSFHTRLTAQNPLSFDGRGRGNKEMQEVGDSKYKKKRSGFREKIQECFFLASLLQQYEPMANGVGVGGTTEMWSEPESDRNSKDGFSRA